MEDLTSIILITLPFMSKIITLVCIFSYTSFFILYFIFYIIHLHLFAVRKTIEASIPIIHSDRDISSVLKFSRSIPVTSLFEMFVSFSNLHILRAIEPALKIRYKNADCLDIIDNNNFCTRSKNFHLGRRSQLARLILDYQTYKNGLLR